MEIVFLDAHTLSLNNDVSFKDFEELGNYRGLRLTDKDNIVSFCGNAEIIIVNKIRITKNIIEKLPKLRLITVIATGYNNVDLISAGEKNIKVANVPDYAGNSVSQHAFSLILNLVTKSYLYNEDVKKGEWIKSKDFCLLRYKTFELCGKTIGIIGFGTIGKNIAKIAHGFGMKVLVYDVKKTSDRNYKSCLLEELLKKSDIISIHCPLNSATKDLINTISLKMMKKTALLINTSRGGIVNEKDLKDALNEGIIAGAGVDVLEREPPEGDSQLLGNVKNLIITPHIAWSTVEARQRMIDITVENIKNFLAGKDSNLVI